MMRFVCLLLALLWAVPPGMAGTLSWLSQERWVTVKKVIDGDTFYTVKGEKVRLLGINTPEVRHDTSPAQPFGKQAKAALRELVAGKQVRLTFDKEKRDTYGRTLAHVYLRNGMWVNGELVRRGLAHVYTFVPNISKVKPLLRLEWQAIEAGRNMWANPRWRVLKPAQLRKSMLGQFRLIQGVLSKYGPGLWRFEVGSLTVTVPKKYRSWFARGLELQKGDKVLLRGRLRMSRRNKWFLSIHAPGDVYHIQ